MDMQAAEGFNILTRNCGQYVQKVTPKSPQWITRRLSVRHWLSEVAELCRGWWFLVLTLPRCTKGRTSSLQVRWWSIRQWWGSLDCTRCCGSWGTLQRGYMNDSDQETRTVRQPSPEWNEHVWWSWRSRCLCLYLPFVCPPCTSGSKGENDYYDSDDYDENGTAH